jgi:hypothetical protein
MDGTLYGKDNEGLGTQEARERLLSLARACSRVRGEFVILWHNSSMLAEWHSWGRLYDSVLAAATRLSNTA